MPDPDLVAYLDGEAGADSAARIERLLRDDPAERLAALALLRQQALLTRLLPQGVRVRRHAGGRRRWRIAGAAVAMAAALLAAFLLWQPAAGGSAAPDRLAAAPPEPGAVLHGDGSERLLPDGTRLVLASAGVIRAPQPGGPWELLGGSMRITLPGTPLADPPAFATAEAACLPRTGSCEIAHDRDGTLVDARDGSVQLRDRVTGQIHEPDGASAWIPADEAPPREQAGARGVVRGTVESVADGGRLQLRTRFGTRRLVPVWRGNGRQGRLDPDIARLLLALDPGDRVAIEYLWQEHLRVLSVRIIGRAAAGRDDPRGRSF